MAKYRPGPKMTAYLVREGLRETACWLAGGAAFLATGNWIWLACGVLGGLGFSIPALITFAREAKERDRASR